MPRREHDVVLKTDTKKKVAMLKIKGMFKSYNETIEYLLFVYENISTKDKERLNKLWNEKKKRIKVRR